MEEAVGDEKPAEFRVASLGRHSLIYGLGLFLTKIVSFVMLPIYTRLLTPADYGVIQLITMTFEVVTILAGSRLALGIFHYYHKENDDAGRNTVLSTALLLLSATYAFAAVLTIVGAPVLASVVFGEDARYAGFIRVAAASMVFEGLLLVPIAHLQLQNRSRAFVGLSLAKLVLQVALNLIFLIPLRMGVMGVLLSGLIANGLVGSFFAFRTLSTVGVRFDGGAARGFVRFGLPLVAMQVATFVLMFGDRYFLNRAGGTTQVGLYGLAYQFGFMVVTVGFAPFQRVWDPQRFAVAKRPDRDAIFARVFIYLSLLLISAALGITLFAGDVIRVIATDAFHPAAAYVPVLAAAYVFQCWGSFLNIGIYVSEKTEYFTLANYLAAGVALLGFLVLVPVWLAWGAALATLAGLVVRCWFAHLFSQRLWRVQYRWAPIGWMSLLAGAAAGTSLLLPELPRLASVAVRGVLFALYALLVWWAPVLSEEERDTVRQRLGGALRPRGARAGAG